MFWFTKRLFHLDDSKVTRFSGQLDGEIAEIMITKHWIILVPFVLKLLFALFAIALFDVYILPTLEINTFIVSLVHLLALTFFLHLVAIRFVNYFLRAIVVTNYRIIRKDHTIFFKRDTETMNLNSVQDISYTQNGLIQRILGYGRIKIYGASSEVVFHLLYIPRVSKYCNMIGHVFRKHTHRDLPKRELGNSEPDISHVQQSHRGFNIPLHEDQSTMSNAVLDDDYHQSDGDYSSLSSAVSNRVSDFSFPSTQADSNAPGEN